jgi:hypothetical protein
VLLEPVAKPDILSDPGRCAKLAREATDTACSWDAIAAGDVDPFSTIAEDINDPADA